MEENIVNGIANEFTYYMDGSGLTRTKNHGEAHGEGRSAQRAVLTPGTRSSARNEKVKGKEPESSLPVVISEDEFELVMSIWLRMNEQNFFTTCIAQNHRLEFV